MLESTKVPALTRAIEILNLISRIGPAAQPPSLPNWGSRKARFIYCWAS